jgi:hypothetical protein
MAIRMVLRGTHLGPGYSNTVHTVYRKNCWHSCAILAQREKTKARGSTLIAVLPSLAVGGGVALYLVGKAENSLPSISNLAWQRLLSCELMSAPVAGILPSVGNHWSSSSRVGALANPWRLSGCGHARKCGHWWDRVMANKIVHREIYGKVTWNWLNWEASLTVKRTYMGQLSQGWTAGMWRQEAARKRLK